MEMNGDPQAIDDAVLALLHLTLHDGNRAWKSFDWDVLNRLHARGLIGDPVNKAKSVILTEDGLRESERLFMRLFALSDGVPTDAQNPDLQSRDGFVAPSVAMPLHRVRRVERREKRGSCDATTIAPGNPASAASIARTDSRSR